MSTRNYAADVTTAGVAIQIQGKGRIRNVTVSKLNSLAGQYEVSFNPSSQIGTAQPNANVIARGVFNANGANVNASAFDSFPCDIPVVAFQTVNVFITGSGNTATVNVCVAES